MKLFKPSPNSLFAVLLRSRWWVSLLVAAAMTLAALALFPRHIAPFAALGALPVWVVFCMAAWRQARAPSPAQVQQALEIAAYQPWKDFADALARAWRAEGYAVQASSAAAYDLRLEKGGQSALVSARRWKAASHGVEPLRALQAAREADESAQAAIYVALQPLSDNARLFARDQGLQVLTGDALAALLRKG
ncbi:MAG: restriction endonuclease [Acidovorax sp.]